MRWIHASLLLSLCLLASGIPKTDSTLMAQTTQSEPPSIGEARRQGGGEPSAGERLGPPEGAVRGPRRGGQGRGLGQGRGGQNRPGAANGQAPSLPEKWIESLAWRSIGPANMSGRITALAVYEKDPTQWWAASASGGLLKTINNGVSFTYQFQQEGSISIGDVQVFQGDPNILWVGTGEGNPRNSSSWGDGVYRSTDGGSTWKNVGLSKTFQIGRISLHPTDPNVAYVGALGRLWGDNPERGLFKTTDAGATWTQVLAIDDQTGVIDVQMHPSDPQTLLVATYQRRRDGFDGNAPSQKYGPGSGIYRTTDGGANWEKLIDGLPSNPMGRIGLQYSRKDPSIVYAIIETSRIGQWPIDASYAGLRGTDADTGAKITEVTKDGPAQRGGLEVGDTVVRVAGQPVLNYSQFLEALRKVPAQQTVPLEVARAGKLVPLSVTMELRPELAEIAAAKTKPIEGYVDPDESVDRRGSPFAQSLGGQNPNMQDQQGAQSHEYGGVYRSDDGGTHWHRVNSLNPRPMYYSQIRVDPSNSDQLWVLGTSLYKSSDGGKTFTDDGHGDDVHVDHHALWIDPRDGRHVLLGNDGGLYATYDQGKNWDHHNHVAIGQFYHVAVSSDPNYKVYGGLQDNGSWGGPNRVANNSGPVNSDWMSIGGGDGFVCAVDPDDPDQIYYESQNGGMGRINLRTGERGFMRPRPPEGTQYRFNWKTPFLLSFHNPEIYYSAGNHVFRSVKKGDAIKQISPEITSDPQGTGSALAESPQDERVLYAGTTDGMLWVTKDGGTTWIDLWKEPEKLAPPSKAESEKKGDEPSAAAAVAGEGTDNKPTSSPDKPAATEEPSPEEKADAASDRAVADRIVGYWEGQFTGGPMPPDRSKFTLVFRLNKENKLTGSFRSSQSDGTMERVQLDPQSGQLSAEVQTSAATITIEGKIDGESLEGQLDIGQGRFQVPFTAKRTSKTGEAPQTADSADGKALKELLPRPMWVSSLEASRVVDGRCYVTIDGHRVDDTKPYILVTENFGRTWKSISDKIPQTAGSAWVVREDRTNPDILYAGLEMGIWVSIDRGESWTRMHGNLPHVAIHEIAQHPSSGEIIVATHGRSIWVLDVTPIRQMTPQRIKESAFLYKPNQVIRWQRKPEAGSSGTRRFIGQNPSSEAQIFYSLSGDVGDCKIEIHDVADRRIASLDAPATAGLHRLSWNMRRQTGGGAGGTGGGGRGGNRPSGGGNRIGPALANGDYRVTLVIDGEVRATQTLTIAADPEQPKSDQVFNESLLIEALSEGAMEEEQQDGSDERP